MHRLEITGLMFVSLLAATPALAASCGPLKLINRVQTLPVKGGSLELVPVTLNGNDKFLLLDTGGIATQISPKTAEDLHIPTMFSRDIHLVDVNGNVANQVATVGTFTLGHLNGSRVKLPVMSNPRLEAIGASGLISRDMLFAYDVDIDFGSHILSLFSQDHCPGSVVYWTNAGVGTAPIRIIGGHIQVNVALDGHNFDAIIDTGSEVSILSETAADHDFGLVANQSTDASSRPVNGDRGAIGHYHSFKSLSFGDVSVTNPKLLILPNEMGARSLGNRHVDLPRLIIGMDILKHLHLYFAMNEDKLYLSGASQPPSQDKSDMQPPLVARLVLANSPP